MKNLDKKYQTIDVIHRAFEDLDEIATVAQVTVHRGADLEDNINFAWRVTQNIEGSWSRDKYMPSGELNEDYNPWVKTIKPLKVDEDGKEWGHRSSSIGDVYVLDTGEAYVVNGRKNRLELVNLDEILKLDGRSVIKHLFN
jgi:hypothetical protein